MMMRPWWLRFLTIAGGNRLAKRLMTLASWSEELAHQMQRCPECGMVKYYENAGPECPGFPGYDGLLTGERDRRMALRRAIRQEKGFRRVT